MLPPVEVAFNIVAVVLLTVTAPLPPLKVKFGETSAPPVDEIPELADKFIAVVALSPPAPVKLMLPPVEFRLMVGAVIPAAEASEILLNAVIDTVPVPTAVACTLPPLRFTVPLVAVSETLLTAVSAVLVVKLLLVVTERLLNVEAP